jgi:4'-phosphopantetheinyl transferase
MPELLSIVERELHVWFADPGKLPPERTAHYLSLLSADEKERYHRFKFERDRLIYLAAHALLRLCLSRYAQCAPEQWRFVRDSYGKPELEAHSGLPPLRFNLTHTYGMVACVIALDTECGIDVEGIRPMRDMHGVARTVFADTEIAWLDAQAEENKQEGFFSLWTLKEAYIKAIGLGFSAPVKRIAFDMSAGQPRLAAHADTTSDAGSWLFHLHRPNATHWLAVAARCAGDTKPVIFRELDL